MAIVIYTYSNPYKINQEPYWTAIKGCFHLCVSQTLVNGLCDQYKDFYQGKLVTVARFINHLYENWESDSTIICQRAAIDNIINYFDFQSIIKEISREDVISSMKRNRSYVHESIRIMFELGMNLNNIRYEELTYEQKCIVAIYKELITTNNKYFVLKNNFSNKDIDDAIVKTINEATKNKSSDIEGIKKELIVIHGIHQFTPIMLRMIEVLSKYKNVIILFNYQPDYKNVYQTWLDVYSWFESKINISSQNFNNETQDYVGGKIADNMAAMICGSTATINYTDSFSVLEFDNKTEFAGYIAKKFENAEREREKDDFARPTLYYMEEQIYAADSSVNDILKIFFPEQFGEREFLDYPVGHFFISIINMWNPDTQEMQIKDLKDIYECLSCGIISEEKSGELAGILDKCRLVISNEVTIRGIIKKLKRLRRRIQDIDDAEWEELCRIEYFDLKDKEIDLLINALNDLNQISEYFFAEFNDQNNDFKTFYKKIYDVLVSKVLEREDIDDDFKDIVQRVLNRLNEVQNIEANASFDCLRETMQLYLQQIPADGKGANWIVRNFEQIDGDILRKNARGHEKIYHFACLSDRSMSITHRDEFPWPLDIGFFEVAQAPVDWKYQVYVTSRMEYKNFRRYALVYGLAFSKCKIALSYIKNEGDKEEDLYYLLRILGAQIKSYEPENVDNFRKNSSYIDVETPEYKKFSQYDLMKYRLCAYRFLMESAIEGNSVYKDEFLLRQYMAIILEHRVRKHFSGKIYVRNIVYEYIKDELEEMAADYPFINHLEKTDTIELATEYIEKHGVKNGKFTLLQNKDFEYMYKRESFLTVPAGKNSDEKQREIFKASTQGEINATLNEDNLNKYKYYQRLNSLCEKCADKDICLEVFKVKKR